MGKATGGLVQHGFGKSGQKHPTKIEHLRNPPSPSPKLLSATIPKKSSKIK